MAYAYFKIEQQQEAKRIVKSLIPRFFRLLYKMFDYRHRYPSAFITANSKVAAQAVIGNHCIIRESHIGSHVAIGDFTTTGPQCRFAGRGQITVGKFCSIAPECLFWSENHNMNNISAYPFETVLHGRERDYTEYTGDDISIGHDVWIGQRNTILAGAKIGHGCVVAAGSVVPRGEYPPYSVIGGVPARIIKTRFDEKTVAELLALSWWDQPADRIFGSMMAFLHKGENTPPD